MRREVEVYLAEDGDARDFMETPVFSLHPGADGADGHGAWQPETPGIGHRIGSYRVERLLGRGGMGAVYLAVRVGEFEQQVALKVLRPGMNTEDVVRRFHHERQILAHLDHPNIAKLLDGGTTAEGLPYFVMEYVAGEALDHYCDRHSLGIGQRLELFRKVCSAVHRAHQNLVVHRDLKPANILVDTDGEPKLLDFGIAKPLDAEGSAATALTAAGVQPMTLAYASPEQIDNGPITTASDVYSLGVVLYQLLAGRPPYQTPNSRPLDLAQAIREQQPHRPSLAADVATPGRPSTEVLETQTPDSLRRHRAANARAVRRRLAGDLDSIVLTALRKSPERRYASVEKLSEDLGRHLEGLPITARKPTFAYSASKFVRRHKLETALAALVLVAMISFSLVAVRLKNEAVRERDRAEEVSDFLVRLFKAPGPDEPEVTVRGLLDLGIEQIEEYRDSQPQLYSQLASTMGEVYYSLGLYDDARGLLEDARRDLRAQIGDSSHGLLAVITNDLAAVLQAQGDLEGAEASLRESLAIKKRLYSEDAPELVKSLNNLATLLKDEGAFEEAASLYRRVLDIRLGMDPPVPGDVATSRFLLGSLLLDQGKFQEAESALRAALTTRREIYGSEHTWVAVVLNNLAIALQAQGEFEQSEELYREALESRRRLLGDQHPRVAATKANLASLLVATGELEEAETLARQALETLRVATPGHWRIAHAQSVVGSSLAEAGSFEEAERLLLASYQVLSESPRECTRYTTDALGRLIDLYNAWGRGKEKERYLGLLRECKAQAVPESALGARAPG